MARLIIIVVLKVKIMTRIEHDMTGEHVIGYITAGVLRLKLDWVSIHKNVLKRFIRHFIKITVCLARFQCHEWWKILNQCKLSNNISYLNLYD